MVKIEATPLASKISMKSQENTDTRGLLCLPIHRELYGKSLRNEQRKSFPTDQQAGEMKMSEKLSTNKFSVKIPKRSWSCFGASQNITGDTPQADLRNYIVESVNESRIDAGSGFFPTRQALADSIRVKPGI